MTKNIKRFLALILTLVLCVGMVPAPVFAAEVTSKSSEAVAEPEKSNIASSSKPDSSPAPEEPSPGPSSEPTLTPELSAAPADEPESIYDTEMASVDAQQVWPALQRARARAAAGVGTGGVLQMGYYCFKSDVGTLTTLGEYVSQMPAKTMLINGTNVAAYCLEHEKGATGGTPYTWVDLSVNAQDTVGTIMALGFQWNAPDFWVGPSDNGDKWAVTQLLIWETINGHAFMQGDGLFGVEAAVDADMEKCAPHAYNPTKFLEYYRDLKKRLNDYMKVPSFASKEPDKTETITLRWDGNGYSATVTDSRAVLKNYHFENSIPGVTIRANGNTLTLSTTQAIINPKTSNKVDSDSAMLGGKGAVAVWRTSDSSQQNFATYNVSGGDPVSCYIKVKTDAVGSAGLVKTSEDGKVSGIQFQITGSDGSSVTKTTDANGNIDLEGMPIYAADGSKITYTATELNVPNRYVKPQSQTFQLTEGQTASIQFENKLKRWRVTVTKADSKTGSTAQGNGSLKGAKFGVYQGGTLVKEYTVGEDLTFTTDYYPFGEDWTLKEISAGEGYKVSTVVTDLCEIPAGSNEEFNDNTVTVTNEVIRGGVSVQKRDSKTGEVPQGDANFAGIVFEIINDSTNTVDVDGVKVAPGKAAKEITTNAQGFATTGPNCLPYGDYIIREKSSNSSMLKTFMEEIPVTVSEDGKVYPFYADNDVVRGGIAIEKRDSKTGEVPQGNADFAGIVFEIINSSANPVVVGDTTYAPGSVVATMTTDENGHAETADDALPYGRYTVREKETNQSMLLTWPEQQVTVSENKKTYIVTAVDDVVRGGISVEKRDTITGSTPQGDADFEGIVFEVINDSRNPVIVNDKSVAPGEVALTLTTDAEGKCSSAPDALPYGAYILHEKTTNESMLNTAPDQPVTIDEHLKVYPFYMDNEVVRGGVLIEKRDLESLLLTPLGGASLDGTLFEITNKSKRAVYVDGALYEPDTVCLTIEVKDGVAQSDVRALPYGTYSMVESKPGKGYLWTDKKVRDFTVRKDGEVTEYREGDAAYNQVIRGDLKFVKVGEKNMHRFANVAFKLTSQTTGESHILVTDENGEVRTENQWNAHSLNTNGNDEKPELEWDDLTGSWYGLTTEGWIVETQDGLCALPFDTYCLEELRCEGNKGYELVTVPNITISRDSTVIELGTIDDHEEENPEIGTTATVNDEKLAEPLSEVTIVDTVRYSGLTAGKTYKLSGVLMDKESGKPLEVDGKQVTAEKEFTPTKSSGTVELSYTFNASTLAGKSVVVFEDLYEGEKKVTSHADIEDEGQTVTFTEPKIGTTATANGEHTAEPIGEITIIDTVAYSELIVGKEYTVKGVLMDKATGEKLLVDGKEVTAEATFRASKPEGTIDIPFTFDASALAGKTVVAFETLYRDKLEVCAHTDIEDKEQTVTFSEKPEIKTTATVNDEKKAEPAGEVTIVDTVTYSGLTPGKTYKLSGVLMDKASNAPLLVDGQKITAEKEFTPENASGTEEITFTLDATALPGKSVVVFETLYHEDREVTSHADIKDEGQTVEFEKPDEPEIKTTATVNGEKKAEPAGEVTIVDTVSYTGLTPGKTYKLSGILMDKATGKPLEIDGNQVTAEKEFTPEKASGTEEITFTFDASVLAGKSVVVFETLYHEDKEVTAHTDINDEDQTVTFEEPDKPKIKTEATVNGEKEADPLEEITLIDKVTYSNLVPGKEYQVKGVLMDKSTGKKLLVDGKEVTSETTFTPDKAEGSVELSFTFNASGLAGKSIVAYETLYHKDIEVAVHADIDDEDQTVTIKDGPKLKTTATIGGKKEATISKEIVLDDKIAYTGLTPGKEYTVKGVLMDKSTGEKLLVDGKEVTAETTFTPEKPDGEVTVSFKFDASGFKEKIETVVFETLYLGDKEIASHADINDKDQTVTLVPEKPKTPTTDVPKTGDDRSLTMPLIMMCVFFAGLLAAIFFWYRFCDRRTGSKKNRR
ncbi:VaFE repeat-containing surface-anchored protein [Acutalibacter sp. 1XD8-36]|uniref:VaFE repeat-containing surface-anchored protein n=1 Tax=Acutalibacter sp. 1XD8-36 TaxID=2320852 RepID=UPI0014134D79|nr:VaFE repeat-containing surface-anchored protein [Acutalibacter sp. 1XD8-36]NBJ90133.1 cell wall protein [Acutalibacter sp. 1XD8-36]